jgi:beta-glucosidase
LGDFIVNIKNTISNMTLEEKLALLSGKDFWRTKDYEKYGLPSIEMADGPCGLRKQLEECDHLGIHQSAPATAQLSGPTLASSWSKELIYQVGEALGTECRTYGVDLLLGPAVNIQRSPLCGRHFEYFSEDPYLTGKVAAAYINGVQSKGVGACIKHFAANNQETEREYIDAVIDERTLREIYLAAFEEPVKEAKPWAVMTALNKINRDYCSENKHILKEILREEWKYEGIVVSDWWGVNDRVRALEAGLDVEMPSSQGIGQKKLENAVEKHTLDEKYIDEACERIIKHALKAGNNHQKKVELNLDNHHKLARYAASQSIVLLKNEDQILPIDKNKKVALIGEFMVKPRFKLEGSALVNQTKEDIPLEEIKKISCGEITYAQGYSSETSVDQEELIREAQRTAKDSEVAVIFAGLPYGFESEGHDRKHIQLPQNHLDLIQAITEVQSNIIVVLANGGPVDMPWLPKVKGVFECFLAGQGMGGALAALLYGLENPSGKLPVTFPKQLCHTPGYFNYPGDKIKVEYKEGIFVGYRYYDKRDIEPLFPFGFGLSYTTFEYEDIRLDKKEMADDETLTVSVKVRNTGKTEGKEVVQLYVGQFDSSVMKPVKELKGFEKIHLLPGEEKTVTFELNRRAFAYYHVDLNDWYVDRGEYKIMLGSSSGDIRLEDTVIISPRVILPKKITGWSKAERFLETAAGRRCFDEIKKSMENYVDESLTDIFHDENYMQRLEKLDIRMITLYTQTVINNDIMEEYLRQCNREYIEEYKKKRAELNKASEPNTLE